jgi:ribokinase
MTVPHVVVVGSTMIDLVTYADPLPKAGETVVGTKFNLGFGGKGANQAVMAARLGAEVTFVSHVGDDLFGQLARETLERQRIDTSRMRPVPSQATGVAPIWVERDGTNRIIVVPGANETLDSAAVAEALEGLEGADCLLCQLEIPQDGVAEALRVGRRWGATTILNPAPAVPLEPELVSLVDWLIPNETEFAALTGKTPAGDDIVESARSFGCGLIVTLGERGAVTAIDGSFRSFAPPDAVVVDTTGAGDAFVGGFAWALASGEELEAAIVTGNVCGALSTSKPGTQTSFPTRAEVSQAVRLAPRAPASAVAGTWVEGNEREE